MIGLWAAPNPAKASNHEETLASRSVSSVVLVAQGEVLSEDLYALGHQVIIAGRVEGDLVLASSNRLEITGEVTGNVTGITDTARITGQVGGSVRLTGLDISITGQVGKDVSVIGWEVYIDGSIGQDLLLWARTLQANGEIGRDIDGQIWGDADLSGRVGRDVELSVGRLRLLEGADIVQDLIYQSGNEVEAAAGALVGGTTIRRSSRTDLTYRSWYWTVLVCLFLIYLIGGLAIIFFNRRLEPAAQKIRTQPVRSLLYGMAALLACALPVLLLLLLAVFRWSLMMLALGAVVIIILLPVYIALIWIYSIPTLLAAGQLVWGRRPVSPYAAFLVSALPFSLAFLIPYYIGPVLFVLTFVLGVGGAINLPRSRYRAKTEVPTTPV